MNSLLDASLIEAIRINVDAALAEDMGDGDRTAQLIPDGTHAKATIIAREAGVMAGQPWVDAVFSRLSKGIRIDWKCQDGDNLSAEQLLCELEGPAAALLSGERAALNFLQTLSAVATTTRDYVHCIADTQATLLDTRKTLPGLRRAQKYAVLCGGGQNHRMGLYDAILIKENHIAAAGSIAAAVNSARLNHPGISVEVEVENLDEAQQGLDANADILMLDNFDLNTMRQAVALNAGKAKLEGSGGVNLQTLHAIAATGVDYVSVGALTKDIKALDLSMRFAL